MPSLDDIVAGAGADEEVDLDFSEATAFEPLVKGRYAATIKDCVPGTSGAGNPKLTWTFVVTDAPYAGRQLMRHTPTKGKGSGLSKQVIKAIGQDTSQTSMKFRPSSAAGKEVLLDVDIQEDNPDFNEIKKVLPKPAATL